MNNKKPDFVYVTYIKTTPQKVWDAITNSAFTDLYWVPGISSDWKKGSDWTHKLEDGTVAVTGKVLESQPPQKLVITWVAPDMPKDTSTATFEITSFSDDTVCLTVTHDGFGEGSVMAGKVVVGWPQVLSSLKSLLETGVPLYAAKACDHAEKKDAAA